MVPINRITAISILAAMLLTTCTPTENTKVKEIKEGTPMTYNMPAEDLPHEGTWLTWPHRHTYGIEYQQEVENIWVQMVAALHTGERVHIVAYNKAEQTRITKLLTGSAVDLTRIDFVIAKSDDVWARDTGPMFVFDENRKLLIADFAFDGWGEKVPYENDALALEIIAELYPSRKLIPIVVNDLFQYGGMLHCVTQQQPD